MAAPDFSPVLSVVSGLVDVAVVVMNIAGVVAAIAVTIYGVRIVLAMLRGQAFYSPSGSVFFDGKFYDEDTWRTAMFNAAQSRRRGSFTTDREDAVIDKYFERTMRGL